MVDKKSQKIKSVGGGNGGGFVPRAAAASRGTWRRQRRQRRTASCGGGVSRTLVAASWRWHLNNEGGGRRRAWRRRRAWCRSRAWRMPLGRRRRHALDLVVAATGGVCPPRVDGVSAAASQRPGGGVEQSPPPLFVRNRGLRGAAMTEGSVTHNIGKGEVR